MAATNLEYAVHLPDQLTGTETEWEIYRYASPSILKLIFERDDIRSKMDGFKKGKDGKYDSSKLSNDELQSFRKLSEQFDEISFKVTAMILSPCFELPDGYDKQRYLSERCIGLYEVFETVIAFFLSILNNSGGSQEGKDLPKADSLQRMIRITPKSKPEQA